MQCLSSYGGKKISQRFVLVRKMLACAGQEQWVQRPLQQSPSTATSVDRLYSTGSKHWTAPSNRQLQCHACSARGVMCKVTVKHPMGVVELCVTTSCFGEYRTKAQHSNFFKYNFPMQNWSLKPKSKRNRKFRNFWKFISCYCDARVKLFSNLS